MADTTIVGYVPGSGGGGATEELDNLADTAVNAIIKPGDDGTIDLGALDKRWNDVYVKRILTGQTDADTLVFGAYDTNSFVYRALATFTANNTPTLEFADNVLGYTQPQSDNTTKIATTAFVNKSRGAAKFWLDMTGGGVNHSYNVDSVTYNDVGDITITLDIEFTAVYWVANVTSRSTSAMLGGVINYFDNQTEDSIDLFSVDLAGDPADAPAGSLVVGFGDIV